MEGLAARLGEWQRVVDSADDVKGAWGKGAACAEGGAIRHGRHLCQGDGTHYSRGAEPRPCMAGQ